MKKIKILSLCIGLLANIQFASAGPFKWHDIDLNIDPFFIYVDNPYEPDYEIKGALRKCEAISSNQSKMDQCMLRLQPDDAVFYTGYKIKFTRQLTSEESREVFVSLSDYKKSRMHRGSYREGLNYLRNFGFYSLIDFDNLNQYLSENGEPPVDPANPLIIPKVNTKITSKVSSKSLQSKTQPPSPAANKGVTIIATLNDLMPLDKADMRLSGCITKILSNDNVIAIYSENGAKIKVKNETYSLKSSLTSKDRKSFYGDIGYIDLTIKTDDASKDKPIDFDFNGKNLDAKIVGTCKY